MANVLGGMALAIIGQNVFEAFRTKLASIFTFSTDLDPTHAKDGSAVTVPLMPAPGTAGDLKNDHSGLRSNAVQDFTSTAVTATLDQHPIEGFHVTDEEAAKVESGILPIVIQKRSASCGYAVASAILNYLINLMTAANFANIAHTGTAGNFDVDDVIDINTTLADAGFPVDMMDEIGMGLKPTYRGGLKKDNAIQDLSASGLNTVETGFLGQKARERVDIFPIFQIPSIPPSGGTPESENLTGFVATSDAIAIAQRIVVPQSTKGPLIDFEVLEDEATGLTLCFRSWYDPDAGKQYFTYESLFGATVGNPNALYRIRSSA